jgi:hypothetical protein
MSGFLDFIARFDNSEKVATEAAAAVATTAKGGRGAS